VPRKARPKARDFLGPKAPDANALRLHPWRVKEFLALSCLLLAVRAGAGAVRVDLAPTASPLAAVPAISMSPTAAPASRLASPLSAPSLSAFPIAAPLAAPSAVPSPLTAAAPGAAAADATPASTAAGAVAAAAPNAPVSAVVPSAAPETPWVESAAPNGALFDGSARGGLWNRLAGLFAGRRAPKPVPPPRDEAERLDRDFAKLDVWAQVGPDARAEIEGLRARRLTKAALKDYVRRETAAAFERVKAARGTTNIGLHYNLHGGARESYVGAGIRASKGDIALRYTTSGDMNEKVYFFQTAAAAPYDALDAHNGEILYFPSRMGYVLSAFAVDAPALEAAKADGRIANAGAISMDFHQGMRGVPYATFLAPPVPVFTGVAKKLGLRRLSRDEETLATARFLEAALTAGGAYVPGGTPASAEAIERGARARARAAAAAAPLTRIAPRFQLLDQGYLYHGTTLDDLIAIVASGGKMAPDVSQFSARARDSVEYAAERRRRLGREDNPEVLLQFRFEDLNALVSGEQFRAALAVSMDRGLPPMHAAYVAATKPVPLSLMTPQSKETLLAWLRAQAGRRPDEPKWAALLPRFEAALADVKSSPSAGSAGK